MNKEPRIYRFECEGGIDIVIAKDTRQAIDFYFNHYAVDTAEDQIRFGGLVIREVIGVDRTEKHLIYNEETCKNDKISFWDLTKENLDQVPSVIVTTNI